MELKVIFSFLKTNKNKWVAKQKFYSSVLFVQMSVLADNNDITLIKKQPFETF